jgi:hypothetical protein
VFTRRQVLSGPLLVAGLSSACSTNSKKAYDGYAFIATQDSGRIAVVDLAAFALEKTIRTSGRPVQLLDMPGEERLLAVSDQGEIDEIEPASEAPKRKAALRIHPGSLRRSFDGGTLWAISKDQDRLLALNAATLATERTWTLPEEAAQLAVSPETAHVAVAFRTGASVALLAGPEQKELTRAQAGKPVSQLAFLKNGSAVILAHRLERELTLLNTGAAQVVVHLPVPVEPVDLCFSSDGGQLFVTGPGLDAVVIVYPFQSQVAGTMLSGKSPGPMAVSTSPPFLFVTSPSTDTVSVHDIRTQKLVAVVAVGNEPRSIVVTPDNSMALVLNQSSGDLAIIRLANIVSKRNKTAPLFTIIPVGERPVAALVRGV